VAISESLAVSVELPRNPKLTLKGDNCGNAGTVSSTYVIGLAMDETEVLGLLGAALAFFAVLIFGLALRGIRDRKR
jgi:hypothetical protein